MVVDQEIPEKTKLMSAAVESSGVESSVQMITHLLKPEVQNSVVVEIEPARCRPWAHHNRDVAWLTQTRCSDLIYSIQKSGQSQPALVRRIYGDPKYDFEIIYGVRRWFACSAIPNQKLLARITEADDKNCIILMHVENADSKDISEFERACSFAQQLRLGIFKNQTEMAEALGVTQGLISRMNRAAVLFDYDWLKSLFVNKLHIKIKPAYKLVSLLKHAPREAQIKKAAEELAILLDQGEELTSKQILEKLLSAGDFQRSFSSKKETLQSLEHGGAIYCQQEASGKINVVFDKGARHLTREALLEVMERVIEKIILV